MSEASQVPKGPPRPSLLLGAAHLAALWALAFLQPMLSLLGDNPEFFIARGTTTGQIILYALSLAFIPPLIGLAIEAATARFSDLLRWRVHLVLMGVVGSALALQILKRLVDLPGDVMIVLAIGIGAAGVYAYSRFRFPRSFMDILTPAPIVILIFFFFFSSASMLILPRDQPVAANVTVGKATPVVMVIFDEFPTASLLNAENKIDGSRYPAFAELASESTWYRNATARGSYTPLAAPAIFTGRTPSLDDLPIASDHPESLFTLLGGSFRMNVVEYATRVCPTKICSRPDDLVGGNDDTRALFDDLNVVAAHLLLPDSLRKELPDISKTFGGFEGGEENLDAGVAPEDTAVEPDGTGRGPARTLGGALARQSGSKVADAQTERVKQFVATLSPTAKPVLSLIHVGKPHYPWQHTPDGQRYSNISSEWAGLLPNDGPWDASEPVIDIALQRHLLEVGYTDTLLSRIIRRLKSQGMWERSTVIVTADHGAAFKPRVDRREALPENLGQIASVPLFIKGAGQGTPETVDRNFCSTGILPAIARQLEIEYPWETEDCPADRVTVRNAPEGDVSAPLETVIAQRDSQFRRIERVFGTGRGWGPVYRFGRERDLIGKKPNQFEVTRQPVDARAIPDRRNSLLDYDPDAQSVPGLLQRGVLDSVDAGQPLAVSVNGRIEAVGISFDDGLGRGVGFSMLLPPDSLRAGYNRVEIFLVLDEGRKLQLLYSGPDDPNAPTQPEKKPEAEESGGSEESGRTGESGEQGGGSGF